MNKEIQGLENYSYDKIIDLINDFIIDRIWDTGHSADDIKLTDIRLHGSRLRNQARPTSDLDAVVEYDGDIREDDFFNILNDDPLYIDDVRIDINPIKEDMDLYMKRSADYDKHKLSMEDNNMIRNRKPTLEERLTRLEMIAKRRKLNTNEDCRQTNEAVPAILAKIGQVVLKYLPLILEVLPSIIDVLKKDEDNDNEEKIDALEKLQDIGNIVSKLFNK